MLLRLSKIEIPELKLNVSSSILALTTGGETIKVLRWDAVDILFWLTMHDCLALNDPIKLNVGRTLRNFTLLQAEAEVLVREERFIAVLKTLVRSRHPEVLWQAAGIIHNLLTFEACKKTLVRI